ncbi:MAG: BrnT family toxin [Pyrinomonadaceae bacterium]|nr:BrnT family toxin [Pyrinomonadaceae bacterium]
MRFEWDEAKRHRNLRRHGIDFLRVEEIFASDALTLLDDRFEYGEIRFLTVGLLDGRVVAISHTETDEVTRIISVRKASKDEEEVYYKESRD